MHGIIIEFVYCQVHWLILYLNLTNEKIETIKLTFIVICTILCSFYNSQGQINLTKYEGLTLDQQELLNNKFSDYIVFQADYTFQQLISQGSYDRAIELEFLLSFSFLWFLFLYISLVSGLYASKRNKQYHNQSDLY